MLRPALALLFISIALLLSAGCRKNPLNMELDPSGVYQMTVDYGDSELFCTLTIERDEDGYLKAVWDYDDKDGGTYVNTAVCFGDSYLAICEAGDPAILDVFTVTDGAINGYWVEYGYQEILPIYGVTEEGNSLPDPPDLQYMTNPGSYNIQGYNTDGSSYVGYLWLDPFGKVISCDQTITPDYSPDEEYWGVGVIIDDHLVMAISSFLCVYTASGQDWRGVLTDCYNNTPTSEYLTYTEE